MKIAKSITLLLLSLIGYCTIAIANPCDQGIGGTGNSTEPEGFGGTGITAKAEPSGGTEGFGGTGIVGVITGFGSVCVNGIEAHFSSATTVDVDGTPSSIEKLAKGEIVAINAEGVGPEVMARHISVVHAVVGKINAVDTKKNQVQIMNQTIQLNGSTTNAKYLSVNQTVAVSGYYDGAKIQASRADVVGADTPAMVSGPLKNGKIFDIPVNLSSGKSTGNAQVSGAWDGRSLIAKEIKPSAIDQVIKEGHQFSLQLMVDPNAREINVSGKKITLEKTEKIQKGNLAGNALTTVRGSIDKGGRVTIYHAEHAPFEKVIERSTGKPSPSRESIQEKFEMPSSKPHRAPEIEKEQPETLHHKTRQTEKPDTIEKIEKIEKVEKIEKIEKPEVPEKVEKIEKPEIEKPEKNDD